MAETPQEAARRLAAGAIEKGYKPQALHVYTDRAGAALYWRIRCKHPDGKKWIRPMHLTGKGYAFGEPPTPAHGRPLYRLPQLHADTSAVVFVVEGETCADALAALGLVATTSGSATSADATDWTPLQGRSVTLWPDNDAPGSKYAADVAAKLRELDCTVQRIAALDLPEHGDAVDWLVLNPGATAADVLALTCEGAATVATLATEPEPLRRPVPPAQPYPLAELGPLLAPAAQSLRRVIQAPDAVCGASVLAAASLATQGLADVLIDGRVMPLSLWLLTVAESGERKSAVDTEALRAAREFEKDLARDFEAAQSEHAARLAEWQARCESAKTAAKKSQGKGLADALQDIGDAPPAPLVPRLLAADFTSEGLAKLLALGWPTVGAFTDEAALVFGGHGMTKETTMRTAATLCKLWDSGTLDRVRALDGATKLYGRRLALHLMAQPVIAERALSDDVLAGQGFLARCLLAWPDSTAGTRPYRGENLRDDAALQRLGERLAYLHRLPLPLADDERQELEPGKLTLANDAKRAWIELHNAIEKHMAPTGRYASVKPWASKTPEQVLRIAGVLALLDDDAAQQIDAATIERATELALWHLDEAARLAGTAALPPETRDAEALLAWCHATGRNQIHSRDALRLGPNRIREREGFTSAMQVLVSAGWAKPIEGGATIDGAFRRHAWDVVGPL